MKISNFRLIKRNGTGPVDWKFKALVMVETGLFFKKTEDREVYKAYGSSWCFADTGEYDLGEVSRLERKYEAEKMQPIEECEIESSNANEAE